MAENTENLKEEDLASAWESMLSEGMGGEPAEEEASKKTPTKPPPAPPRTQPPPPEVSESKKPEKPVSSFTPAFASAPAASVSSPSASEALGDDSPLLSQHEIDSLLGIHDVKDAPKTGMRMLLDSVQVSHERMPMLEIVYERFVRLSSSALRHFSSESVDVDLDSITSVRFGDYLNQIPLPAMVNIFRAEEWNNYGLLVMNSRLIYSVLDVLLGGRRSRPSRVEGRAYTVIESNLIERIVTLMLEDLSAAFESVSTVSFRFERQETNPRFASIALPTNAAVLAKFYVDIEDRGGEFEIILPYGTLEPVRSQLGQLFRGEAPGINRSWVEHFSDVLRSSSVELTAVLDEFEMKLGDVANLKKGSLIHLQHRPDSLISMRANKTEIFLGEVRRVGKQFAVLLNARGRRDFRPPSKGDENGREQNGR